MGELKYRKAFDTLKSEILSGKYTSRKSFPSLVAACARFKISRLTAVKAFDKLKEEGLISTRVGAGTFVTKGAKSRFIGLVVPGISYSSEFFQPIIAELVRLARKHDYTIMMDGVWSPKSDDNGREAIEVAARLIKRRVAGVIYQPLEYSENSVSINRRILSAFSRPSAVLIRKNPDWVERNPDGSVRLGKWGRPVLNFRESGLREYLYALLGYLVADVGVDGFRCDVAETQPLDFWEEAHRRLSAIKSDVVLICEGYGCPGEQERAFDCCYDWMGMEALRGALDGRLPLSRIREEWTVKRTHCECGARFLRYVENHDETDASQNKGPRGDSDERWGLKRMEAALFYCFTSDGVPFLYNGNEFADHSFQRMLLKTPIDWSMRDTPEGRARLAFVRKFARLRQTDAAFSTDATLTWVDNDCPDAVLSYLKQAPGSAWLCVVNLSTSVRKVTVSGYGCHELGVGEWKLLSLPVCVKEAQFVMTPL